MGRLFENLVVVEALKSRVHRGKDSGLYFFRDHNGNEVDLLYPEKDGMLAVEIKSARTFQPHFLKGIRYYQKLSGGGTGMVVYAGDREIDADTYVTRNFLNAFP